ncbi:MAG: PAS domain S-box protein [Syntrophobacteraceae bacterium]|jgi:PAS domain S-box-containing protein|nr:PAS domain S-box protein [Syntrophobacteraceae bacterium]
MSKISVLVVEDEAIVAADLAGKLRQLGYEVAGMASEGEEAIALAARCCPDLVLMDIRLRGSMDGIEAAEAMRNRHDVPVIYLTAHSDAATLTRAKVTGPFGYILKPFEERGLATQIELALYRHRTDRQNREQREWLRVTLSSIGDAVIATDAEGRITFVNPVAEMLTGWKGEEAMGRPMEDPVERVLREGHPVPLTNHAALLTRDGRNVPIEDSAAPILNAEGRLLGAVLVFHDVTGKRRAEEALQQAHERLEKVLGSITDGYYALDADWRFVALNPAAERHFGRHATELIGKSIWEITKASPEEEAFRRFHEARASGQPLHFEARSTIRPDFWAEMHLYPQDGTLEVYFSDISDRKRAEEALRASEELNRRTMHALPAHIAVLDREGRILAVNERWMEFAAQNGAAASPEVAAGANYLEVCRRAAVADDDLAIRALAGIEAVLQGASEQFTMEYPCHAPTEKRWFFMSVVSLGSGGEVEGAVVTHLTITERKQVEDALRQSEERLRFHRERMPIGCIVHDEELRFLELNPAAEHIFGYSAEELIGQPVRVIVPPEARPHVDGILRRLAAGDMTAHSVNENLTRDGRIILCDWMNTPLKDSDGKLLGLLSMVQDVTERKRAEDMLRESEARYRELVQHANSAIIRWRADGTITFFNEYAQGFFGWSTAEILGEHIGILVPERESTGADMTGLVHDIVDHPDLHVNNINENVCRDGRRVWMTWTNRAIRDELGRVTEILAIGLTVGHTCTRGKRLGDAGTRRKAIR